MLEISGHAVVSLNNVPYKLTMMRSLVLFIYFLFIYLSGTQHNATNSTA